MRRASISSAAVGLLLLVALGATPARADHSAPDNHSGNLVRVGTFDHGGTYRQGSDLAFWGTIAVLGNYDNPGGFRLLDISDPKAPKLLGQLECPGPQNDVSIWEDLVFLSVDSPRADETCEARGASQTQILQNQAWEGIRIISIADPSKPTPVAMVKTDCGSHTHTLVPDLANDRVLVYVLSYPLGGQGTGCNALTHRKISVVEVPLSDPKAAKVISTPSVSPAIGCHDVTVFLEKMLAAAACLTESQIWDISDPENPTILGRIVNPLVNIHHSSAFSWDGNTVVIGDELGGAVATPGCFTGGHAPLGALWFYDVSDPESPQQKGWFQIPQQEASLFCTAHNFNVIPLKSDKDLLVSGWYNGGSTVIDFTDPSEPKQVAYYTPKDGATAASWSTYWYNGFIWSNNFDEDVHSLSAKSRGFDVFRLTDATAAGAVTLPRLNAQVQEPFRVGTTRSTVRGSRQQRDLPATGTSALWVAAIALLGCAAGVGSWARAR